MTDELPPKPDRFAAARAAKAAKDAQKKAVDAAKAVGESVNPATGEIAPSPSGGRWANDVAAAASDGAPKPRWELDLNVQPALPKPGWYRAQISEIRIYDRPDVLWLQVRARLLGEDAEPAPVMEPLAADPASRHAKRVTEGRRLLNRLAAATGVPATGDYGNFPDLYEGKNCWARVAVVPRDGVNALELRSLADRNPETGETI